VPLRALGYGLRRASQRPATSLRTSYVAHDPCVGKAPMSAVPLGGATYLRRPFVHTDSQCRLSTLAAMLQRNSERVVTSIPAHRIGRKACVRNRSGPSGGSGGWRCCSWPIQYRRRSQARHRGRLTGQGRCRANCHSARSGGTN